MGSGRKHKGQGISRLKDEGRYIGKPGEPADSGKNSGYWQELVSASGFMKRQNCSTRGECGIAIADILDLRTPAAAQGEIAEKNGRCTLRLIYSGYYSRKNIESLAKACQAALNRLIGTDSDGGNT